MPGKSGELADENLHVDPASLARAGAASAHADKVVMLDGPVTGGKPHAIAPGVVAIPAVRGQMVYIRLAGGSEVLLVGDASPLDTNWRELRAPARWWHRNGKVERDQSYAALRAIARLHGEAPGLIVVPGRHIDWLRAARTPALKQGFSPA